MSPDSDSMQPATEPAPPAGLAIFGDFTCTMTPEAATLLLDALSAYPRLLLDTDRFITRRTANEERLALVAQIRARGFCEPEQAFDLGSGGYYLLFRREPGDVTASPPTPLAG